VKAFLDQAAMIPRPKMWDMPPSMVRHSFAGMMGLVGAKSVPVGKIENFAIPGPAGDIPVRAYAPVAAGGDALPALIYFHGGGFVVGDLDTHDGLCRLLVSEGGFRVIAVRYRLAPEHKWPAPLDDAFAALRHIFDNAFPGTEFTTDTSSMNKFAVGYFMEKQAIEWFYSQVLPSDADRNSPRVSPLKAADFSGLPPAYIMLGGYDPLHDEGLAYAQKLRDAGVQVTVADYADMVHCFIYLQTVLPQAHDAVAAAAHAVHDALDTA